MAEEIRPLAESTVEFYCAAGIELDHDVCEGLAWTKWASEKTNDELADVVNWTAVTVAGGPFNRLYAQLIAAAIRLRHPRKFGQRKKK